MKKTLAMLAIALVGSFTFVTDLYASEALLYAVSTGDDTSIFAYEVAKGGQCTLFSDAESKIKIMARGGAQDSVNVIEAAGHRLFAVGRQKGAKGRAGALYEVHLDGSNQLRKIADVRSEEPIERIAVDRTARRIAYPSLQIDTRFTGEGTAHLVSAIFIHDTKSGAVLKQIDLLSRARFLLASYLGWSRTGDSLYIRLNDETRGDRVYLATSRGALEVMPLHTDVSKRLIGQSSNGYFVFTVTGSADLLFEDKGGHAVRKIGVSAKGHGWNYKLSMDGRFLAFQTLSGELWIEDLRSGKGRMVPLQKQGKHLTLIGWTDSLGNRTKRSTAIPVSPCQEK